jgi:hypothetical protein
LLFCEEALSQGHSLTLLVRNPGKLPSSIRSNTRVSITEGQLNDKSSLQRVASSGASIFISFAGPVAGSKGTVSLQVAWSCLVLMPPEILLTKTKGCPRLYETSLAPSCHQQFQACHGPGHTFIPSTRRQRWIEVESDYSSSQGHWRVSI